MTGCDPNGENRYWKCFWLGVVIVAFGLASPTAGAQDDSGAQNSYLWTAEELEIDYDPFADLDQLAFSIAVTVSVEESERNDDFPHDSWESHLDCWVSQKQKL